MYLPTTKEIITQLKQVKEEKKLSIPRIQKMCEDAGHYIALNTFRNIFAAGSEDGSFSYERTIRPIASVLLPKSEEDMSEEQVALLAIQIKHEREEHKKRTETLNRRIDALQKKVTEQEKLIKELLKKI